MCFLCHDPAAFYFQENEGFLAEAKDRQEFFRYLLRLTENVYNPKLRVWVYSEMPSGRCSAFEKNYVVEEYDCYYILHPFICEKGKYKIVLHPFLCEKGKYKIVLHPFICDKGKYKNFLQLFTCEKCKYKIVLQPFICEKRKI